MSTPEEILSDEELERLTSAVARKLLNRERPQSPAASDFSAKDASEDASQATGEFLPRAPGQIPIEDIRI